MKAFQKQAEASLAQAVTGLVFSTVPKSKNITRIHLVSIKTLGSAQKAVHANSARGTITVMFVVFGLLTSGA